jgi:hypothetical protein
MLGLLNSINISSVDRFGDCGGNWALELTRHLNGDLRLIDTFGVINLRVPRFNTSYRANFRGEARKLACLPQRRRRATDRRERFPQRKPERIQESRLLSDYGPNAWPWTIRDCVQRSA